VPFGTGCVGIMAADEEGTLAALNARRLVIDALIERHHGRIFTTAGDSVIAEFASAVDAVRCAAMQGEIVRRFADFAWRTLDSWSRTRRVIAKAEHLPKGTNPRFVVTSLAVAQVDARTLYEDIYCTRGQVENRIKEQQLDLFADRTPAATLRANQLRLWFASFAYVLLEALRRIGLRHTQFATATSGTIRLKLLKIGAQVWISVRRIKVAMASACPYQADYHLAYLYLQRAATF